MWEVRLYTFILTHDAYSVWEVGLYTFILTPDAYSVLHAVAMNVLRRFDN